MYYVQFTASKYHSLRAHLTYLYLKATFKKAFIKINESTHIIPINPSELLITMHIK
jgi:hypothetical protein